MEQPQPSADDLGAAYKDLRWVLATVQNDLGGGVFAKRCVTSLAREVFGRLGRLEDGRHQAPFTQIFTCSAEEMREATRTIQSAFRVREDAATHEAQVVAQSGKLDGAAGRLPSGARLVLRDLNLYFETPYASVLLAHAYDVYKTFSPSGSGVAGREKWAVATTDELGHFTESYSGRKPSASVFYTKTREAALKGMLRVALECLGAELRPLEAVAA